MRAAIVVSPESWIVKYAQNFVSLFNGYGNLSLELVFNHKDVSTDTRVVFLIGYFELVDQLYIESKEYVLVVHESALPKGRGWSPLSWQILEGKNTVPIVMFQASEGVDSGDILYSDVLCFQGTELVDDLRYAQAKKTFEFCKMFFDDYPNLSFKTQNGDATYYPRRNESDSELDINASIKEQFNLLRIVDNDAYPAFFTFKGSRYILKISKME